MSMNGETLQQGADAPVVEHEKEETLALPVTASTDHDSSEHIITVGGESIRMDKLGPIILNTDGTMSRITNWPELTENEQKTTLRLISKRNKQRREVLLAQAKADEQQTADGNQEL
eukprot:CAMPEP_0198207600 /NCGR_PEP_ID=MMETSP1445-20131203/11038_1 /TAXON_ID=36898 /ORGANISM="Pyramimonas sp., Strain CCMP2087" /LENGTH=115 /DNA_ID=CAMNT_0043880695 /DNA_START=340 /DNA_END=687 /DNA_ORIENTATION=+